MLDSHPLHSFHYPFSFIHIYVFISLKLLEMGDWLRDADPGENCALDLWEHFGYLDYWIDQQIQKRPEPTSDNEVHFSVCLKSTDIHLLNVPNCWYFAR